jgi:hypothetical protein
MLFITLVCFIVLILQIFHIKHQLGFNPTRHLLSSSFGALTEHNNHW